VCDAVCVDGLVDCADPGCCRQAAACIDSPLCRTAPDPLNIVLRKQPPSPGSTFYDRVKFLVDDDSVQSYADRNSFQRRCVCACVRHSGVVAVSKNKNFGGKNPF